MIRSLFVWYEPHEKSIPNIFNGCCAWRWSDSATQCGGYRSPYLEPVTDYLAAKISLYAWLVIVHRSLITLLLGWPPTVRCLCGNHVTTTIFDIPGVFSLFYPIYQVMHLYITPHVGGRSTVWKHWWTAVLTFSCGQVMVNGHERLRWDITKLSVWISWTGQVMVCHYSGEHQMGQKYAEWWINSSEKKHNYIVLAVKLCILCTYTLHICLNYQYMTNPLMPSELSHTDWGYDRHTLTLIQYVNLTLTFWQMDH